MKTFVELVCEDLTSVSGPMGSERVTDIFRKAFTTIDKAKKWAEKDHKNRAIRSEIKWRKDDKRWYSGDLLSHSYTIFEREIL